MSLREEKWLDRVSEITDKVKQLEPLSEAEVAWVRKYINSYDTLDSGKQDAFSVLYCMYKGRRDLGIRADLDKFKSSLQKGVSLNQTKTKRLATIINECMNFRLHRHDYKDTLEFIKFISYQTALDITQGVHNSSSPSQYYIMNGRLVTAEEHPFPKNNPSATRPSTPSTSVVSPTAGATSTSSTASAMGDALRQASLIVAEEKVCDPYVGCAEEFSQTGELRMYKYWFEYRKKMFASGRMSPVERARFSKLLSGMSAVESGHSASLESIEDMMTKPSAMRDFERTALRVSSNLQRGIRDTADSIWLNMQLPRYRNGNMVKERASIFRKVVVPYLPL